MHMIKCGGSLDQLKQDAVDMFRSLTRREPTIEEMAALEASFREHGKAAN